MAGPALPANDPALVLDSLENLAVFLADAFESGDAGRVADALALVARSPGMTELAAAAGLPRGQLESALGAGELKLDVTLAIMKVIDLHLPPRTSAPV